MQIKLNFLTVLYFGIIFEVFFCQEWINMKFKSVKCKNLDPSYAKLYKCFVKPISRNESTLNVDVDILKVMKAPIFVESQLLFRYTTISRPIYPKITFDFCAVMRGDGVVEKFTLFLISFFRDSIPQLFHKCPFYGRMNLPNITLNVKSLPMDKLLPTGIYKAFIATIHNKTRTFEMEIQVEIASKLERF
jgi:hypothetical protein